MKLPYIYILTNKANSTLYIGVTANLIKRIWEHKNKIVSGFTSRYNVNKLVYFEEFEDISLSIARERRLKEWPRQWKIIALFTIIRTDHNMLLLYHSHKHISYPIRTIARSAII